MSIEYLNVIAPELTGLNPDGDIVGTGLPDLGSIFIHGAFVLRALGTEPLWRVQVESGDIATELASWKAGGASRAGWMAGALPSTTDNGKMWDAFDTHDFTGPALSHFFVAPALPPVVENDPGPDVADVSDPITVTAFSPVIDLRNNVDGFVLWNGTVPTGDAAFGRWVSNNAKRHGWRGGSPPSRPTRDGLVDDIAFALNNRQRFAGVEIAP